MTVEIDIPLVFTVPDETSPDQLGAFMAHAPYSTAGYAPARQSQPLSGLSVGIKDLYDVAGLKTGAGSPAWFAQAKPAQRSAPAVVALLDAGAQFVGKTLTDELAWSLNGENFHYGTPVNVAAPGRIPGGSSAGSAAAV
ncbi:MAG: amidase family protein, partial [Pseudomonadota bacterium]